MDLTSPLRSLAGRAAGDAASNAGDEHWAAQMRSLGDQVLGWTGNRMEYVVLTVEELRSSADRSEPIIDSWRADCVTVLGRPFEALLAPTVTVSRRHRL